MTRPGISRLACVTLLSSAAVGVQITLMRLFSIMLWQHFAAMIISLTLLGYGASGSALAFAGPRLGNRPWQALGVLAALFGIIAPLAFIAAAGMGFSPQEALWEPVQFLRLAAVYLTLGIPFFMAGAGIGLALYAAPEHSGRIYAADQLGAGCGPALAVGLMLLVPAQTCLTLFSGLAFLAAALALSVGGSKRAAACVLVSGLALTATFSLKLDTLRMSEYKDLPRTLLLPGARVLDAASGPLGVTHAVESPQIPLRFASGLGFAAPAGPPRQIGVFSDGNLAGVVNAPRPWTGILGPELEYLEHTLTALPYRLTDKPAVFLARSTGPGGPLALQALRLGARSVAYAAPDKRLAETALRCLAMQGPEAEALGSSNRVRMLPGSPRSALISTQEAFDIIIADLSLGHMAATAVSGDHLLTVQGVRAMLDKLSPGGVLALAAPMRSPPRAPLKLLATTAQALSQTGRDPHAHIATVRSWDLALVLATANPINMQAIETIVAFCRKQGFDTAYYPGMPPDAANRHNKLPQAYLHQGALRILSENAEDYFRDYRFDIRPATDDRPFFNHFLKPGTLRELLQKRDSGGLALVEQDYPVLMATIFQALAAGFVLIVLPLAVSKSRNGSRGIPLRSALYFLALGLSFLALEMAFLNMFALALGDPMLGAALAVGVFLVFAGTGSRLSAKACDNSDSTRRTLSMAVTGVAVFALGAYLVLGHGSDWLLALPMAARAALISLALAPAAVCMGMPFPLGIYLAGGAGKQQVAWGWALNGWASVLSAALAQLLAVHFGFLWVIAGASALYLAAGYAFRP